MTIDEAIRRCEEVAERYDRVEDPHAGDGLKQECIQCAADHRQLAEWLTELKEAKRLLKAAVEQMSEVGDVCDCIHSQNCPLDECGKFTFHDEIMKFISN